MHSFRALSFVFEFLVLILILFFLFIAHNALQSNILNEFVKAQTQEISKIDFIINSSFNSYMKDFQFFYAHDKNRNTAIYLNDFSDIFYVNLKFHILEILKKESDSQIFEEFDFSKTQAGVFFSKQTLIESTFSPLIRATESKEQLSVYMAVRDGEKILIGRVGIQKVLKNLKHFADSMGSIIMLATYDGYILSSTRNSLPLSILPSAPIQEISLDQKYFYIKKECVLLNTYLVVLTPMTNAFKVLQSVKDYYLIFILIVSIALFFKVLFQIRFIIYPLEKLTGMIRRWEIGKKESLLREGFLKISEIVDLHDVFLKKSEEIDSSVNILKDDERQLRSMRQFLKNIIDSMPSMLISIDRNGIINEWNKAAWIFTKISPSEAIGNKITSVLPYLDKFKQVFEEVMTTGKVREINKEIVKNGTERLVNISVFPLGDMEKNGLAIRLDDISEIEKIEAQLRQTQKMEMIGTLSGGLAHDFNNVLGGIIGTISLIQYLLDQPERNLENLRSELKDYVETLDQASKRASDIVSNLLMLSHKTVSNRVKADLKMVIHHVHKVCISSFDKSVEISQSLPPGEAYTFADPSQLEQVLLNICVNASHALTIMKPQEEKQGGIIHITLKIIHPDISFFRRHPDTLPNTEYWEVSIADNGVGMDSKTLSKIFEPFFTTKEKGKGTGLGLSMVYSIVKQHNGFIDVYSEPGKGSVFNLFLPAVMLNNEKDAAVKKTISLHKGSGLILVIDDEPGMRKLAYETLTKSGYQVLLASNGQEGLVLYKLNSEKINLVLLDMVMPKQTGLEVYRELKKMNHKVKVILSSGFSDDERIKKGMESGVNAFIKKPYTIYELSEIVFSVLRVG